MTRPSSLFVSLWKKCSEPFGIRRQWPGRTSRRCLLWPTTPWPFRYTAISSQRLWRCLECVEPGRKIEWKIVVELPSLPVMGRRNSEIAQPSPFFMFSGWTSSTCTNGYFNGMVLPVMNRIRSVEAGPGELDDLLVLVVVHLEELCELLRRHRHRVER